jgi:hypothetical protein
MAGAPTWPSVWSDVANRRRTRLRLIVVVALATVSALLAWSAGNGPGWLGDGPSTCSSRCRRSRALTAAFAAVLLAFAQEFADEPFALFTSRRPAAVAALWLVAMVAAGMGVCGLMATQQGETPWEPSDTGWFVGWVLHFLVIGGLLVLLWWIRARCVWIVAAPVLTGLLAFLVSAPGGWAEEDADFRDDATFADGLDDVLPYTLTAGFLMGLVVAVVFARASTSGGSASRGWRAGRGAPGV